ncbi:MAG: AarF/UbiB family protein [Candidatus Nanohaloarchaea archaeon]
MIRKKIGNLKRFDRVLKILLENEMGFLIEKTGLSDQLPFTERLKIKKHEKPGPERLRETLEELGSIYVKFGQILAQRPDLIPRRYCEELGKLEDHVPSFKWKEAEKIIEEEIGLNHFENIDEDPIAAASIAQVHKATLENGEEVVIKVKRPCIDEKVEQDLKILEFFTKQAEKHSKIAKRSDALEFVNQFSSWTREELDLEREGLNAQIFKENLKEEENLKAPKIYPELNTEKVLVMEYVKGVKCTNTEKLKEMDIDAEEIAETAVRAGIKQSIIDGFFHADPHPSNFLLTEDSKIIYMDFGMMGKVSHENGEKLGLLLVYLIREDIDSIIDCLEDLGTIKSEYNREGVEEIVKEKVLILKNTSLKQTSITKEMFDLFVQISDEGLQMPSNMALLGKNLVTMEGIALTIYPDFRIQNSYEDVVKETLKKKNSPDKLAEDFTIDLIKNKELFTKLPTKLNNKLDSNEDREINITQDSKNIETLPAGLIISSGLIFTASPFYPPLAILGIGQLGLGLYLHHQTD